MTSFPATPGSRLCCSSAQRPSAALCASTPSITSEVSLSSAAPPPPGAGSTSTLFGFLRLIASAVLPSPTRLGGAKGFGEVGACPPPSSFASGFAGRSSRGGWVGEGRSTAATRDGVGMPSTRSRPFCPSRLAGGRRWARAGPLRSPVPGPAPLSRGHHWEVPRQPPLQREPAVRRVARPWARRAVQARRPVEPTGGARCWPPRRPGVPLAKQRAEARASPATPPRAPPG